MLLLSHGQKVKLPKWLVGESLVIGTIDIKSFHKLRRAGTQPVSRTITVPSGFFYAVNLHPGIVFIHEKELEIIRDHPNCKTCSCDAVEEAIGKEEVNKEELEEEDF